MNAPSASPDDFTASFKEWDVEALIDRWFYRPIAELVARGLASTSIRPNQISFASALAGIAAALCYWQFTYPFIVAGGLWLSLSVVFDAADGQLARRTGRSSETGKLFDNFMDPIKAVSTMFGITFGMDSIGNWGPGLPMPEGWSASLWIWASGWFVGLTLLMQVVTRNAWVDRYDRIGKGRTSLTMADLRVVRREFEAIKERPGLWLEKTIVPLILALSPKVSEPLEPLEPSAEYARAMRPYIRLWTFFGGGQQFFVLTIASLLGAPVWGWIYIGVFGNTAYLLLMLATWRVHRRHRPAGA